MIYTSEQIANIAGCSSATVSRVLNNSARVSPQKREAVLRALGEAGIVPRRRKRGITKASAAIAPLRTLKLVEVVASISRPIEHVEVSNGEIKVGPIALCPPDRFFRPENRYSNSYYRRIIDGITDELTRWQMRPVIRAVGTLKDRQLVSDIHERAVQGLLLLSGEEPDMEKLLSQVRCPVVIFGPTDSSVASVATDDMPGMRQAIRHLAELGHTRIAYVAGPRNLSGFSERITVFKVAMAEAGLTIQDNSILISTVHIADIAVEVEKVLAQPNRPTAFVCCYDCASLAILQVAAKQGLNIPHDLSLIGFGDSDIAEAMSPALTTVHMPVYEMGRAGVGLLIMQQMSPSQGNGLSIRLRTSLVVRASTAPPATKTS